MQSLRAASRLNCRRLTLAVRAALGATLLLSVSVAGAQRPDLRPIRMDIPAALVPGTSATVTVHVENVSTTAAASSWSLGMAFSPDSSGGLRVTPLGATGGVSVAPNAIAKISIRISLPSTAPATLFLRAVADMSGRVDELDEGNNTLSVRVGTPPTVAAAPPSLAMPDLVPESITLAASETRTGSPRVGKARSDSIRVSFVVVNRGTASAPTGWSTSISRLGASYPEQVIHTMGGPSLAPGASTSMSAWVKHGIAFDTTRFLASGPLTMRINVDAGNVVAEGVAESNNVATKEFKLSPNTDYRPLSAITVNALVPGSSATLTVVVANQGLIGTWSATNDFVRVRLVSLVGGEPLYVGSSPFPAASEMDGFWNGARRTLEVPLVIPELPAGQFRVEVVVDPLDRIAEYYDGPDGESNNLLVTGIIVTGAASPVGSPTPSAGAPDLVVSSIAIGTPNVPSDSVVLTYTIRNQGAALAYADPSKPIRLSMCVSFDGKTPSSPNCAVGLLTRSVAAGASSAWPETVALHCEDRPFYLIVTIDSSAIVSESSEANNSTVSAALPMKCP